MSTTGSELVQQDLSNVFNSGVGSSIDITSECRDLSQINFQTVDEEDEDLYNESSEGNSAILLSLRESLISALQSCQGNIAVCQPIIAQIVSIDEPLHEKCTCAAVLSILPMNSTLRDEGNFQVIAIGVDILIKYGVNLLKPKRNPNWRSIKMSNGVFIKKVKPLKGHGKVLVALGYSECNLTSFDFPGQCQNPDLNQVSQVTADLLVLQKEFFEFCNQTHVNREGFLLNFSTLQIGSPKPDIAPPVDTVGITLEEVKEVPTSPTSERSPTNPEPKRPVPAPRRNVAKVNSPDMDKTSEFANESDPEVRLPPQMTSSQDQDLQKLDTTPVRYPKVRSPSSSAPLFSDSDVVPSVGPIKFPPRRYSHEEEGLQNPSPPDVEAMQSSGSDAVMSSSKAPTPQNANRQTVKPEKLMKPADFLANNTREPHVPTNTHGFVPGSAVEMQPEDHGHNGRHQAGNMDGSHQAAAVYNIPQPASHLQAKHQSTEPDDGLYYMNFSGAAPPIPPKNAKQGNITGINPVGPPEPHYQHITPRQQSPMQQPPLAASSREPFHLQPSQRNEDWKVPQGMHPTPSSAYKPPNQMQPPRQNHYQHIAPHQQSPVEQPPRAASSREPFQLQPSQRNEDWKVPQGMHPTPSSVNTPPSQMPPPRHNHGGRFSPGHQPHNLAPRFPPQEQSPEEDQFQRMPPDVHPQAVNNVTVFPPQEDFVNHSQIKRPPGAQPTPFLVTSHQNNAVKDGAPFNQSIPQVASGDADYTLDRKQPVKPTEKARSMKLPEVQLEKCAMCEGKPGVIHCDKCKSARCESCDKRWHSHPKRKAHQTRRLDHHKEEELVKTVTEVPKPKEPRVDPCFVCDEKEDIDFHCRTCSQYFCRQCDQLFHGKASRSNHERVLLPSVSRSPMMTPPNIDGENLSDPRALSHSVDQGARPKQVQSTEVSTTREKQRDEQVHSKSTPARSKEEELQMKLEDLVAKDVSILEKLAHIKSRFKENLSADIEGQLIKEEKHLSHRHQELMDQIDDIKAMLKNLAHGERKESIHQERNSPLEAQPGRPSQFQNQGLEIHPEIQQSTLPAPLPVMVIKWMCEHCTFLNEEGNGYICAVCSKTTSNPEKVRQEVDGPVPRRDDLEDVIRRVPPQPLEVQSRGPQQSMQGQPGGPPQPMKVQPKGPPQQLEGQFNYPLKPSHLDDNYEGNHQPQAIYKYESPQDKEERLKREQEREQKEQEEAKRMQQQENLTMRLLLMYRDNSNLDGNQQERFSIEEVATAWSVTQREGLNIMPVEWLSKHLSQQLKLIGGDITREFCRKCKLNPKEFHGKIPDAFIYDAWLKNDGIRENTAADCVGLLHKKLEEFLEKNRNFSVEQAANILMNNDFDVERANWLLQVEASGKEREAAEDWLNLMWEETKSVEDAITAVECSDMKEDERKKKIRRILMAELDLLWAAVDTFFHLRYQDNHELSDCLEAVMSSKGHLVRARDYFKDCSICFDTFVMSKLLIMPFCQCHVCTECFTGYFTELSQSTPCMYKFSCPYCEKPDLEYCSADDYHQYFTLLEVMLRQHLDPVNLALYQQKLVTWGLIKEENFRWCANGCANGFINEGGQNKIQCANCKGYQCFECKKPWMDQHQGITCEEFDAWKKENDPEFQAQGLAAHLKENGINCPKCKMRYELAKGGCMHFKCTQCMHEFCCGCNMPFTKPPHCKKYQSCAGKGLHAHHPRDCLYHLRDQSCETLQKLLQDRGVDFNRAEVAANLPEGAGCPVKEQRESEDGLVDANCGRPLHGNTGLCETHYKEYLVSLINQNKIDPADIFTADELEAALRRDERQLPRRQPGEADDEYRTRLMQLLKDQLPLQAIREVNQPAAAAAEAANRL